MITISPITEMNKNNIQTKKRPKEPKVRVVIKENVKEFKSKTCILPNYCKYFYKTVFYFRAFFDDGEFEHTC